MKRLTALPTALARRVVGSTLAVGLVAAPLPGLSVARAAPPADAAPAEAADAPAEATVGGNVAILKFAGDEYKANDFRARVQSSLNDQGYTANFIKRSIDEAAQKNKCKVADNSCLDKIGAYLNKNSTATYDFYMWAEVPATGVATVNIYDIAAKKKVVELSMITSSNDFILAEVVGAAIAQRLVEVQVKPTPITPEEETIIAALDEPAETPEEVAAREAAVAAAVAEAGQSFVPEVERPKIRLKEDFDKLCRTGPREDNVVEGEDGETTKERDLRPPCKRGPAFGYWQPRAWVAFTLTLGSAATMGAMYGLAAAAKSDWGKAKDELEASGLVDDDPYNRCNADGVCYEDLAGAVSDATHQVRTRAIVGDVFLGATVLLTGVLAIIIFQDRQAAKSFLEQRQELDTVGNLQIGPMFGNTNGAALSFDF